MKYLLSTKSSYHNHFWSNDAGNSALQNRNNDISKYIKLEKNYFKL